MHMSSRSVFDTLPESVLIRILAACEIETLFVSKQVCHLLERIVRSDLYLQYKIELAVNGMVDGPPTCPLLVSERLAKLREWSAEFRSGMYKDTEFEYSFQRWPRVPNMPTDGWECHVAIGASLSYALVKPPQGVIHICAPPSFTGERKMREWSIPLDVFSRGGAVATVSVDLSQDLLVVVQKIADSFDVEIHLRSLSNPAAKHPLAVEPALHARPAGELQMAHTDASTSVPAIQIHGRYVALTLHPHHNDFSHIEVWDWRAGPRLWTSDFHHVASFTFLDAEHIIVALFYDGLQVFRFASPERPIDSDGLRLPIGPCLLLKFPANTIGVHVRPTPIPAPPSPDEPFWPDPDLRAFVVNTVDVPATLIPYSTLRRALTESGKSRPVPELEWEEWSGPGRTLALRAPHADYRWYFDRCYPYGSRAPIVLENEEYKDGGDAIIYDVNPWAARYARHTPFPRSEGAYEHVEDLRASFGTEGGEEVLHVAIHGPYLPGVSMGQEIPAVAMNHNGFTTVFTTELGSARFVGTITNFI